MILKNLIWENELDSTPTEDGSYLCACKILNIPDYSPQVLNYNSNEGWQERETYKHIYFFNVPIQKIFKDFGTFSFAEMLADELFGENSAHLYSERQELTVKIHEIIKDYM